MVSQFVTQVGSAIFTWVLRAPIVAGGAVLVVVITSPNMGSAWGTDYLAFNAAFFSLRIAALCFFVPILPGRAKCGDPSATDAGGFSR
jgi:hypothetical protein